MSVLSTLLVTIPRDTEVTPEMASTFLSTFPRMLSISLFDHLIKGIPRPVVALEIGVWEQKIRFMVTCSSHLTQFVTSQIQSTYPLAMVTPIEDPLPKVVSQLKVGELQMTSASFYPIRTWSDFRDTDPMNSYLSVLSKAEVGEVIFIQFALGAADSRWQSQGQQAIDRGRSGDVRASGGQYGEYTTSKSSLPEARGIQEKIAQSGFALTTRLATTRPGRQSELAAVFGVYGRPDGNSFSLKSPLFGAGAWQTALLARKASSSKVVSLPEMATIWHLPSEKVKIPMIVWGTAVFSEPPENLPVADGASEEERAKINFFGRTIYKNRDLIFGIKESDRRRHVWAIGKTGTGKSTFIANMAIDDLKKGRGMAIIDPHGDLSEILLNYIPASRINDVIYFNPVDRDRPVRINVLEVKNPAQRELVVSGIVAIFNKMYGHRWGPRVEYTAC